MTYLDTSALIKRLVEEPGTSIVRALILEERGVSVSKVAYAEVYAGLTRKRRQRALSSDDHAAACQKFEEDWQAYIRIDVDDGILVLARDLIVRHPLRGFDAIHLASALDFQRTVGEQITFVAADERLLKAASAERLRVLDVESTRPL